LGRLEDSDIPVYIDLEKLIERHSTVIGVTGSGKTYMVQRLIARGSKYNDIDFLILDPQGEYEATLKRLLKNDTLLKIVSLEPTILPISVEDLSELFEFFGYGRLLKNTTTGRVIKDIFAKYCKPSIYKNPFLERNLKDLFEELKKALPEQKEQFNALIESIAEFYGEEALTNQPQILKVILSTLKENKKIKIFDFSKTWDGITRLNLAGLVLKTLLKEIKRKTLVVMEEAHYFAPEKGFSELPHGKRNLALIMAEWIAAEGRKFGIGLLSITQRPAQVSKFILSQANTQFLFKLIGKNDLSAVESYLSYTSQNALRYLPDLKVGECIAGGVALPFEVKLKVA
jgi:DNA helicase HerA-like ATPase